MLNLYANCESKHNVFAMNTDSPKHCHRFKLDYMWTNIVDQLIANNSKQMVSIQKKNRVSDHGISIKKKETPIRLSLVNTWKTLQINPKDDLVLFATHLNISNFGAVSHTISKLPPLYRLDAQHDLQKYYLKKLNGLNEVQFFVKGNGAWTGLHAEDCLLSSFNINMGPGNSIWTIIPMAEIDKLAQCSAKHLNIQGGMDLRSQWHSYYFSEEFLNDNGIEFEKVVQPPGYAIYFVGYSIHQVINVGVGVNMAWNLAPFTRETLEQVMEGYRYEFSVLRIVSMVPVLRVIHIVLFKYFDSLAFYERKAIVSFLGEFIQVEENLHQQLIQKNDLIVEDRTLGVDEELPFNNCFKCMTAFYLRYYICSQGNGSDYMCAKCALSKPPKRITSCISIINAPATLAALNRLSAEPQIEELDQEARKSTHFPGQGQLLLKRVDQKALAKNNLSIAGSVCKAKYLHERLEKAMMAQRSRERQFVSTKDQKLTEHLRKAIAKKSNFICQLRKRLNK